jgi:hypothetical protein
MERVNPWMAGLLTAIGLQSVVIGGFLYSTRSKPDAAKPGAAHAAKFVAKAEKTKDPNIKKFILIPKAAERLDIKTGQVRVQQVTRKRRVEGEVLAPPKATVATAPAGGLSFPEGASAAVLESKLSAPQPVLVRVPFDGDVDRVAQDRPARILPVDAKDGLAGKPARLIKAPDGTDAKEAARTLYYQVADAGQELSPGERVRAEIELTSSGTERLTVPFAAVIYEPDGRNSVYTNPEPLVFIRHYIKVDYVEGDLAILSDGPPVGTAVVTDGAIELFGAEFKVGHGINF